jgi:hypothetical protein
MTTPSKAVRPTVTRKALFNQPKYPAARTDAYIDHLEAELAVTRRALEIVRDNYLEGDPIEWAMEQARKERGQ